MNVVKSLFLVMCTFLSYSALSLGEGHSSIQEDSVAHILNPNWKKNSHFIELSAFIGFVSYQPTAGALGYKYLYSTDWDYTFKFGTRLGVWGGNSGDDVPDISARNFITYSAHAIGAFPVWKSTYIEVSSGFASSISWPTKTNTQDQEQLYSGVPYYSQKIGANIILYKHANIELGSMFLYNTLSKNWNSGVYLSIGYKF